MASGARPARDAAGGWRLLRLAWAAIAGALGVAREAADIIVGEGFDRSEVELGATTDARVAHPEIRIFVR